MSEKKEKYSVKWKASQRQYYGIPADTKMGYIYEHRLVAERMLGRPLTEDEIVYHRDRNGLNNKEDNLMVFATRSDINAYLKGRDVHCIDGVWHADMYTHCKECGKRISNKSKLLLCADCYKKEKAKKSKKPPKSVLEGLLKESNYSAIGRMYGVSDNAVRKWAKSYELL